VEGMAPAGFEFHPVWWASSIEPSEVVAPDSGHEWMLSAPVAFDDAASEAMVHVVERAAATLRPLVDVLLAAGVGGSVSPAPEPVTSTEFFGGPRTIGGSALPPR